MSKVLIINPHRHSQIITEDLFCDIGYSRKLIDKAEGSKEGLIMSNGKYDLIFVELEFSESLQLVKDIRKNGGGQSDTYFNVSRQKSSKIFYDDNGGRCE